MIVKKWLFAVGCLYLCGCDRSEWKTSATTDPLTDKVFNHAAVQAENGPWRLILECEQNDATPFAAFEGMSTLALTDKEVTGEYRVDREPAQRINIGYYGGVLAFPPFEQAAFLRSVAGKDRLAVKISDEYPVMVFRITGIDRAIAKICNTKSR